MGLFISAGIVTLHGGKISVRSAGLGKGTTFTVVLPVIKINDEVGGIKSDVNSELFKPESLIGIGDSPCDQTIFTAVGATRVNNSRVLKRLLVVDDSLPNRSVSMMFFAVPLSKVMLCVHIYFRKMLLRLLTSKGYEVDQVMITAIYNCYS